MAKSTTTWAKARGRSTCTLWPAPGMSTDGTPNDANSAALTIGSSAPRHSRTAQRAAASAGGDVRAAECRGGVVAQPEASLDLDDPAGQVGRIIRDIGRQPRRPAVPASASSRVSYQRTDLVANASKPANSSSDHGP